MVDSEDSDTEKEEEIDSCHGTKVSTILHESLEMNQDHREICGYSDNHEEVDAEYEVFHKLSKRNSRMSFSGFEWKDEESTTRMTK